MEIPWYEYIEKSGSLVQGDIIKDVEAPYFIKQVSGDASEEVEEELDVLVTTAIVITQSCDILKARTKLIQLCPCIKLDEFNYLIGKKGKDLVAEKEKIRKGLINGCHMLNKEESLFNDFLIVDFSNVISINKNLLLDSLPEIEKRARLNSPYREKFAQEFGRYFMRIGLPFDIPQFK